MKYCCSCGAALPDTAAFCSACGKAVDPPVVPAPPAAPAEAPETAPEAAVETPVEVPVAAPETPVETPVAAPVAPPAAPTVVYEQPVVQPTYAAPAPKNSNLFAILAMAAGGTALTFAFIALAVETSLLLTLFAIGNGVVAIVFSGKARGTRLRGLAKAGKILAIIGLVFGGLALISNIGLLLDGDIFDYYVDIFDT